MKHYHRLYRYGTLGLTRNVGRPYSRKQDGRKIQLLAEDHPLISGKTRYTYLSRILLYEKHKEDKELTCRWCGCKLDFRTFEADHIDEDPTNDDIENLAISCPECNVSRSRKKGYKAFIEKCCLKIEYKGKVWTTRELAEKHGISYNSVLNRYRNGWSPERIVCEARGVYGPKNRGISK